MSLWDRVRDALDPDRALMLATDAVIQATATRYAVGADVEVWRPGRPLSLLLAGYVGTRNTGADVRVEEMIRQLRVVLGEDNVELNVLTNDLARSAGYFRRCRQTYMPPAFPKVLLEQCPRHHGVVACEGSMFKSKFSSALTTFMAGALGMANAEGKLSVGFGAEAGQMTPDLQRFVERSCRHSLVMCRNEPSRGVLERLGVRTTLGTDTAWTFEPAPAAAGEALLRAAGWDGETPVLAVCPINPFWWPVRPDLAKTAAYALAGEHADERYKAFYFHSWDADKQRALDTYLDGLAEAVNAFASERRCWVVLIGMETLDRRACDALAPRLSAPAGVIDSADASMYELVSALRRCRALVSSRYHAIVTSMPATVPSAGVTMDERIRNLMHDRGHEDLYLEVDDPALGERLLPILRRLWDDGDAVRAGIARALPRQLELMGQMGIDFMDEACRVYPDLPRPDLGPSPLAHLPSMGRELQQTLERYA
ncbi:MAG: polysaccharide pyruvyl transferase family protein [Myxococcales bacterium]|nr:polysaccharide pyruvyl transferase family protein [Myxococcales bacterium]MCB9520260.1 polysaccharide pyruvyl transferase family protein [Myxococcales bacterium]MCB9531372.1 polysaccharide pyruvyl transferase family protein [Myxococcales bacterium]MCB9533555.1 polysaccharide pyruvyl transferase family protein [Myxococcales bacterium]